MADYVISRQSRDVSLVYRCSACNNPVLINSPIVSVVKVSSSIFNTTTPEEAGTAVMDQFEETINDCYKNKETLGDNAVNQEELINNLKLVNIDPSKNRLDCEVNEFARGTAWLLMDESTCCPICGKHEIWQQKKVDPKDIEQLSEDNFPKVYHSDAFAGLFIKLWLQEKYEKLLKERMIPNVVDNARKDYQQKKTRQQEIEMKLAEGLDQQQVNLIAEGIDTLNGQLKQLKTFDFKAKKSINQQISEKQREIDTLKSKWKQEENHLKEELHQLDLDLRELEYLVNGTSGTAEIVWSRSSRAYRLIANPVL